MSLFRQCAFERLSFPHESLSRGLLAGDWLGHSDAPIRQDLVGRRTDGIRLIRPRCVFEGPNSGSVQKGLQQLHVCIRLEILQGADAAGPQAALPLEQPVRPVCAWIGDKISGRNDQTLRGPFKRRFHWHAYTTSEAKKVVAAPPGEANLIEPRRFHPLLCERPRAVQNVLRPGKEGHIHVINLLEIIEYTLVPYSRHFGSEIYEIHQANK